MAASLQPDLTPAKDQTIDTLKELLGARRALVKDRTAALNRSKGLTLALLKRQSDQHLRQIAAQIPRHGHADQWRCHGSITRSTLGR